MLNYIKLRFEWYHIQNSNNLFYLFFSECDYLFVCLFVCFWCVFDVKTAVFWIGTVAFKHWIKKIQKKLWTEIFDMLNYITFWFEWYQIHIFNNVFVCFSLFAIVCLFICLFIYEAYLTSKTPFLTDTVAFKHRLRNPLKIYEYEFLIC